MTERNGTMPKKTAKGCGRGCLVGLSMLVALPLGLYAAISICASIYAAYFDLTPYLGRLRPEMTVEEARAVFPGRFQVKEQNWDGYFVGTWVVDPERPGVKRLVVDIKEPSSTAEMWVRDLAGMYEYALVHFDAEGRLCGVRFSSYANRPWRAKWGTKYEGRRCDCNDEGMAEAEEGGEGGTK
jgi:hypothetical protein